MYTLSHQIFTHISSNTKPSAQSTLTELETFKLFATACTYTEFIDVCYPNVSEVLLILMESARHHISSDTIDKPFAQEQILVNVVLSIQSLISLYPIDTAKFEIEILLYDMLSWVANQPAVPAFIQYSGLYIQSVSPFSSYLKDCSYVIELKKCIEKTLYDLTYIYCQMNADSICMKLFLFHRAIALGLRSLDNPKETNLMGGNRDQDGVDDEFDHSGSGESGTSGDGDRNDTTDTATGGKKSGKLTGTVSNFEDPFQTKGKSNMTYQQFITQRRDQGIIITQ